MFEEKHTTVEKGPVVRTLTRIAEFECQDMKSTSDCMPSHL